MPSFFSPLLFFNYILLSHGLQPFLSNTKCNERCGRFQLPFPFHLTNSCSSNSTSFRLFCSNSTTLYIYIESQNFQVLDILSDSILIDIPTSSFSSCHQPFDVSSFTLKDNQFYGVSNENLIRLYDCVDSSVCKVDCEQFEFEGCVGTDSFGCCYPLSDHSVWQIGDGFSVFGDFGCRRFESWVVETGVKSAKWGIKIEWAIPRNSSEAVCSQDAVFVNATAVTGAGRCVCKTGFVGDGFAQGVGCSKSCIKDGRLAFGVDCHKETNGGRKAAILAGVLVPAIILAAIVLYYAVYRPSIKSNRWDHHPAHLQSVAAFRRACRTRLFTYKELEDATKGFDDDQKIIDRNDETVHSGVLNDGSLVAVYKIECDNEHSLMQTLLRIEFVSAISHKNVARLLGCCIKSGHALLVVYEFFANGALDEYLRRERGKCLDWNQRVSIAAEAAKALAYLQFDISPPVFYHDLKSSDIYLDTDYSIKIAGFQLLKQGSDDWFGFYTVRQGSHQQLMRKSDVFSFGVILMEMITGLEHADLTTLALQKMRDGKLDEIVDPILCYRDCPSWREQIDKVANVAMRCLSLGGDGKLSVVEVAGELMQIAEENVDSRKGVVLEETFSTSSLLQMISMSPDSLYVSSLRE